MGRPTKYQVMERLEKQIRSFFQENSQNVYHLSEIKGIMYEAGNVLGLPWTTKAREFISFLEDKKIIEEICITLPLEKKAKRFITKNASIFEIGASIKGSSYISHYSAMFLHGLTDNIPKTVYTNTELKKAKNMNSKELQQGNIDRAFACNPRKSNQIAKHGETSIYLLNSKNVGQVGVKSFELNNVDLRITSIERTLIDITVRPNYAGGVEEILGAFEKAKGRFSVNRLVGLLKKLDYTYPYHQAIGFYMEKAGYEEKLLRLLEKLEIKYNFYLTYKMKEKDFSERWKLFHPKWL